MQSKFDAVVTATLVVCALITTGLVVRREMRGSPESTVGPVAAKSPVWLPDWHNYLDRGERIGSTGASVQLVEFADFECPFCGTFHQTMKEVRARYPSQVALTFVHFPLPMHRFAIPAARVAECARNQGHFEAMHDQLFEGQDHFGLKPWVDYATAAAVPDMTEFDACVKNTNPIPRVEEGKALGAKLDVHGTPTVIINGWKLEHPPSEQELEKMVQRVLAGKQPVDGKS